MSRIYTHADRDFLYLATDGKWLKIGVSICPERRLKYLTSPRYRPQWKNWPVSLVQTWCIPRNAGEVELQIKRHLRGRRAYGGSHEWFKDTTKDEVFALVRAFCGYNPATEN